jgi:thiamine-phosphate diphosphorylase/hydroxyethylthiazole kinase
MGRYLSLTIAVSLFGYPRVLAVTIASELAAARPEVHGSGTFLPALIDELYNLTSDKVLQRAKVEVFG